MSITIPSIHAAGLTHTGLIRDENQDCIYVDPTLGLYIVLDGMGGHKGGATASQLARQVIVEVVKRDVNTQEATQLLVAACVAAGSVVHKRGRQDKSLRGMGTTVVAVLMPEPNVAIVAHVGDSRAYLMRDTRLQRLTNDHAIVAELVAAGKLTPEQAVDHPHASVLSRNLGGHSKTEVDVSVLQLQRGDRLLLCSDGLNGYSTQGAIEHVLGGAKNAESATQDLIDLAKRGGGGDNISALVIEIGEQSPGPQANILHETGARAWWQRRALFMDVCQRKHIAQSTLVAGFQEQEAEEILAGSFFEAVYHDLENTSGVNVWTYADSLVRAWFERDGDYRPVRELLDTLRTASLAVIRDVSTTDQDFGVCLEIALLRSLIVTEMVVGGQIGNRIRTVNDELASIADDDDELPEATFANVATQPYDNLHDPMPASPDVSRCLEEGFAVAQEELTRIHPPRVALQHMALSGTHDAANDYSGDGDMLPLAKEVYGNRLLSEQELAGLTTALESCRLAHLAAIDNQNADPDARATAYHFVAWAHQCLAHTLAMVAIDAGKPTTDRLHELEERTKQLRAKLARNEMQLSKLETALTTLEDSLR